MWLMPPPGLNPDCLILPIMAYIVEKKHAAANRHSPGVFLRQINMVSKIRQDHAEALTLRMV
jgi:hypothetical protein